MQPFSHRVVARGGGRMIVKGHRGVRRDLVISGGSTRMIVTFNKPHVVITVTARLGIATRPSIDWCMDVARWGIGGGRSRGRH